MNCLFFDPSRPVNNTPLAKEEKWCLTAANVTFLAVGILGSACLICSMTPLAQTSSILGSVASLGSVWQISLTICSVTTAGIAVFVLIYIHKPASHVDAVPSRPQPEISELQRESTENPAESQQNGRLDALFEPLKAQLSEEESLYFEEVKKFLANGYSTYLKYYNFYYCLARISEAVIQKPELKEQWRQFLNEINNIEIDRPGNESQITIDCSIELERLEGRLPELKIEELTRASISDADCTQIAAILRNAFANFRGWSTEIIAANIRSNFFNGNDQPYVIRNKDNNNVLGFVILCNKLTSSRGRYLFFHTLARSAPAVKLRMTEALKEFFLEKLDQNNYEYAECDVLKDNAPARYVYEKLGFVERKEKPDRYILRYTPPGKNNGFAGFMASLGL